MPKPILDYRTPDINPVSPNYGMRAAAIIVLILVATCTIPALIFIANIAPIPIIYFVVGWWVIPVIMRLPMAEQVSPVGRAPRRMRRTLYWVAVSPAGLK